MRKYAYDHSDATEYIPPGTVLEVKYHLTAVVKLMKTVCKDIEWRSGDWRKEEEGSRRKMRDRGEDEQVVEWLCVVYGKCRANQRAGWE